MQRDEYKSLMKIWEIYEAGIEDHACTQEEFTSCEVCENSWEARTKLGNKLTEIVSLLEKYHDSLDVLTDAVVQEVAIPRPERVQMAMLRALKVLDKTGKSNGADQNH